MDTYANAVMGSVPMVLVALVCATHGCSDSTAPTRSPSSPTAATEPTATEPGDQREASGPGAATPDSAGSAGEIRAAPPAPALADGPVIDLLANRYRLHLYPDAGSDRLHIPLAAEGLRKYTRDYRSPWGEIVAVESARARVLSGRRAALDIPIDRAGEYRLWFGAYSENRRQRVTVTVNGQRLDTVELPVGWHRLEVGPVALRAGDNRVEWQVKRRERIATSAGKVRSYGLWQYVQVAPDEPTTHSAGVVPLSPVSQPVGQTGANGAKRAALTGFARMELYLEVPERAWLEVTTEVLDGAPTSADQTATERNATTFRISALTAEAGRPGRRIALLDHVHKPGQQPERWPGHQISLAPLAGQLVRLQLTVDNPNGAWVEPRIALEKAAISDFQPVANLVLLVVDTLRADRLSLYADTRVRTRHITAAAARGAAVFAHNQAASPSSPPSHASIHTGTLPRVHGVAGDAENVRADVPLLSALARAAGLMTGYVGNNNFAMSRVKKQAQFHRFYEPVFNKQGVDCRPVSAAMAQFVADHPDERFFLSGLPIEPHVPYRFHEGITDSYFAGPYKRPIGKRPGSKLISRITAGRVRMDDTRWQQIRALYDGEVHHVDECFGTFMAALEERGRLADTAIIITADHGEGMYEHGRMGHAFGHFAELSNVPFIVIWPPGHPMAGAVRKHETVTSLIDIAPTALSLLGLPADARMQGRDMLPVMRRQGPWPARVVPMEYGKSFALRARDWKYMVDYSGRERLYHAAVDPTEQREIADQAPMALRYMRESAGFYLAHRTRWTAAEWGEFNDHGPGLARYAESRSP